MEIIFFGLVCFLAMVFSVYVFVTRDKSAAQDALNRLTELNASIVDFRRKSNEADLYSKNQTTELLRISEELSKLSQLVGYHDLRLANRPMKHIHFTRADKKYEAQLIEKIKAQISALDS